MYVCMSLQPQWFGQFGDPVLDKISNTIEKSTVKLIQRVLPAKASRMG